MISLSYSPLGLKKKKEKQQQKANGCTKLAKPQTKENQDVNCVNKKTLNAKSNRGWQCQTLTVTITLQMSSDFLRPYYTFQQDGLQFHFSFLMTSLNGEISYPH